MVVTSVRVHFLGVFDFLSTHADPKVIYSKDMLIQLISTAISFRNYYVLWILTEACQRSDEDIFGEHNCVFHFIAHQSSYDVNIIKRLHKAGMSLESRDKKGNTILHILFTAYYPNYLTYYQTIDYLLSSGFNPNFKNNDGYTPLLIAAKLQQRHAVKFAANWNTSVQFKKERLGLLKMFDFSTRDKVEDLTVLHFVCKEPSLLLIAELYAHTNLNPCSLDNWLNCAFHYIPKIYVSSRKFIVLWEKTYFQKALESHGHDWDDIISELDEDRDGSLSARRSLSRSKLVVNTNLRSFHFTHAYSMPKTHTHKKFLGQLNQQARSQSDQKQDPMKDSFVSDGKYIPAHPSSTRALGEVNRQVGFAGACTEKVEGKISQSSRSIVVPSKSIQRLVQYQHSTGGIGPGFKNFANKVSLGKVSAVLSQSTTPQNITSTAPLLSFGPKAFSTKVQLDTSTSQKPKLLEALHTRISSLLSSIINLLQSIDSPQGILK